jgi:hypothetical protein
MMATQVIRITEEESIKLIHKFMGPGVRLHFGPGWVGLPYEEDKPLPESIEYLAELRGVTTENCDGAGI